MKILLINGPNLQLLGRREPGIYGCISLEGVVGEVKELAKSLRCEVTDYQSNHEGSIVDRIGSAKDDGFDGILINPAAYSHTSVAIRDAISAVALPTVEVHLSNIHTREEFRHHSFVTAVAVGVIAGFGADSYTLGLRALVSYLQKKK